MFTPDSFVLDQRPAAFRYAGDMAIDLSVVIVSYNTRDVTRQAVASVLDCAEGLAVEVIVVDNQSSDGSVEALRAEFAQVKVIAAGENGGYARGNNIGISEARGRHVLVLNPDAVMHPGSMQLAVRYMDSHPDVGLLGARALYETGVQQSTLFRDLRLSHLLWRTIVPNRLIRETRFFGDQRYASRGRGEVLDVDVVAGCFMMLPRDLVARIGAMDDRFFMYSEESEWCWRVRRAGRKVRYHPQVTVTHHGAVSTGRISPWKAVEIARGQILFLRFTRSPAAAWAGNAIMLAGDLLRGTLVLPRRLAGRGGQDFAIWRARVRFLAGALVAQPRGQAPRTGGA